MHTLCICRCNVNFVDRLPLTANPDHLSQILVSVQAGVFAALYVLTDTNTTQSRCRLLIQLLEADGLETFPLSCELLP